MRVSAQGSFAIEGNCSVLSSYFVELVDFRISIRLVGVWSVSEFEVTAVASNFRK